MAVCHDCGAVLCPDHATEATHLTVTRALGRRIPADRPERRIRSRTCSAAIAAAFTRARGPPAGRPTARSAPNILPEDPDDRGQVRTGLAQSLRGPIAMAVPDFLPGG